MDIDGWELLSDDSFLDFNEDDGENQIFYGKRISDSKSVFDMNHFCTSPKSRKPNEESMNHQRQSNQLVHLPIQFEPRIVKAPDDVLVEENTKDHVGDMVPSATKNIENTKASHVVEPDQDSVSHVFFKIKENEFVDMKMDSPKSGSRGVFPPIDAAGGLRFEEKGDEATEIMTSPRMKKGEKEMLMMECGDKEEEHTSGGFNFWKWSLTGVGAICSFGIAAATICVLFFGSQQRNKIQQDHKIRFQIYTDDKRIKQVVQHATKLNEAISAARGVPSLSRAHITYGGYYDSL